MALVGTNWNDVLYGTPFDDLIYGLGGADLIFAYEGNDDIYGGTGNDIVYAGAGDDLIYGEDGNDQVFAGSGNDLAYGGFGDDLIDGEAGDDLLFGDAGNDRIIGGFGSDFQSGGSGNDVIESHAVAVSDFVIEKDDMTGGAGRDTFRLRTDYAGGAASIVPYYDASFAIIRDFNRTEDRLDLKYDQNYVIRYGDFYGGRALDTVLTWQNNTVAVVQDVQLSYANLS
ncbi:MAG: calcium-binding protein [Synechococcales cyanobacterium C42_A2020_086]|jgi:Ca2+-binding RTX toxin-like protein|nr:calcium-binding protein [Synechococcales cyanobacterium M58_A2018_015]MBF2072883.1 calcium-binding protein [Synechococcales cyanobacterium C42_A2020_086]